MATVYRSSAPFLRKSFTWIPAKRSCGCNYYSQQATKQRPPRTPTTLPHPRIDYRDISENVVYKTTNALNRKAAIPADMIPSVVRAYSEYKRIFKVLNAKRNDRSIVGERIRKSAEESDPDAKQAALDDALQLKKQVADLETELSAVEDSLTTMALSLPNDTHPDSPLGPESAAVTLSTHGPEPLPSNHDRDHVAICRSLGLLDLESGATVTGSSWYYLLNEAALLEIALTNYALSVAIKHGYTPVTTPDVVRSDIASRCGFQPRDQSDPPVSQMYHITPHAASAPELVLAGTSEIPLAGMFANKVFATTALPLRVVGLGRAFRAEAGARGADTRGLYRVHQFTKVELFAVTTQEESEGMMGEMLEIQKKILISLGFPLRVLDMPTEGLGASAYRKFDIEAWMPGRGSWGEVSSLSNCTDYQSRRLHIRYRPLHTKTHPDATQPASPASSAISFAHTLNGTAAAIPRLIVALLENGATFNKDGDLTGLRLPEVLKPFWIGGSSERNIVQWGLDPHIGTPAET